MKSVKSINPFQSPPASCWPAGVIQTTYDIVKAHGGEMKVDSCRPEPCASAGASYGSTQMAADESEAGKGTLFTITLPIS